MANHVATSIRMNPTLRKQIEAQAKKEGRSINNMIERLLDKALNGDK